MLNAGQVVYDFDNDKVVIFAGLEMLQNKKTGDCSSYVGFIELDDDGNPKFVLECNENDDYPNCRKYTNFLPAEGYEFSEKGRIGKIPAGSFISYMKCGGVYFGILNDEAFEPHHWAAAKKAIEEFADRGWTLSDPDDSGNVRPILNTIEEEEQDGSSEEETDDIQVQGKEAAQASQS